MQGFLTAGPAAIIFGQEIPICLNHGFWDLLSGGDKETSSTEIVVSDGDHDPNHVRVSQLCRFSNNLLAIFCKFNFDPVSYHAVNQGVGVARFYLNRNRLEGFRVGGNEV